MLQLSGSFGRRILISSTIMFPIVGLLALICLTGSYIRVKGQLFDPEQGFCLLWERLDVQERLRKSSSAIKMLLYQTVQQVFV